ncbi:hypothetical protein oki169_32180 [Helicobacter pylori]|nr:Uncharacterised protein [Campylobacter jejuni subsp. doylei]
MSNINAFLFGFTNMFNADILKATSLKDRKTMITDFHKKSEELRKHSNEEYNAKFEKSQNKNKENQNDKNTSFYRGF